MNKFLVAGGLSAAAIGAVSVGAAYKLFNSTIPRQDGVKVDISEMADMARWEEYKKLIGPRSQWLQSQPLEEVWITSFDGLRLHSWFLPAAKPSDKFAVITHGYTSKGLDSAAHAFFFHSLGFNCFLPDHRAHGYSEGDYAGFGIVDRFDCRSWIDYIQKRYGTDKEILLHGTSMGASTVLMVSGMPDLPEAVRGIISDCAFTSPHDVFAHILKRDYHLPEFPIMNITTAMCRKKAGYGFRDYSTLTAVRNTKCPILFIHGAEDKFVPTWMTHKNFEACRSPKDLLIVENAGHGASCYEDNALYESTEAKFIDKWFTQNEE